MKEEKRPFTDEEVRTKFLDNTFTYLEVTNYNNNFACTCSLSTVKRLSITQ